MKKIWALLEALLGEVYLVGGAVRDLLLGRDPQDLDFATPLPPEEVARRLAPVAGGLDLKGAAYGTVAALLDGVPVEITTFRRDVRALGRKAEVAFGASLEEDLARRDFTVNAMALTLQGRLVDPFGGARDLEARVIRAVGDPRRRFAEDLLRVVRAVRFAAALEARVEEATWQAALEAAQKVLGAVSLPRLGQELTKGLLKGRGRFVALLNELGLLYAIFPELVGPCGPAHLLRQNPAHHPEGDVLTHLAQVVDRVEVAGLDPEVAVWAAFLHDVGKPATAEPTPQGWCRFPRHEEVGAGMVPAIARRFGFSNAWSRAVERAVRLHMRPLQSVTPRAVRRFQAEAGEHLPLLRAVCFADGEGRRQDLEAWFAPQGTPPEPLVRGRDLLALGFQPGPAMGALLRQLYDLQLEEGLDRDDLLAYARSRAGSP